MNLLDLQKPDDSVPAYLSTAPYLESSSTTEISCIDASQSHSADIPEDEKTTTSQFTTVSPGTYVVPVSHIVTLALCVCNAVRSTSGFLCLS